MKNRSRPVRSAHGTQQPLELTMPNIDVAKLVSFTPNPQPSLWKVSGGSARWRGQIGRFLGVLSIKNARADAIVLHFDDNSIACFNGIDLFPAPSSSVEPSANSWSVEQGSAPTG